MSAEQHTLDVDSEQLVGKLTETALEVTLKHGVAGFSVDLEVDLWQALERVSKVVNRPIVSGKARHRSDWETVLAAYTDSAYRAAIRSGVAGSFLELEMGLWHAFRKVLTRALLEAQVTRLRRFTPKTSASCRSLIRRSSLALEADCSCYSAAYQESTPLLEPSDARVHEVVLGEREQFPLDSSGPGRHNSLHVRETFPIL